MNSVKIQNQTYELISWSEFGGFVLSLAKNILKSGEEFDRLVALAKGGTAIARPIGDLCGIKEFSSMQIEFYTGIATTNRTPVITQDIPVKIKGEKILVIDDIADSGETLTVADKYITLHGADVIKTATLITKPWTKFKPDYSFYQTEAWVIFPWEARETIGLLAGIWRETGLSDEVILENLRQIGFSEEEISLFFI